MLLYATVMFAISGLFFVLSLLIFKGKTELIHSYHQTRVTDKSAYGKAFGKALSPFGAAPLISGIIGLIDDSQAVVLASIAVLMVGIGIGTGCIVVVQKKYNNGIF